MSALINWNGAEAFEEYVWKEGLRHHAVGLRRDTFDAYARVSGNEKHPQYVIPGSNPYGCFSDGSGRNFYGAHTLCTKVNMSTFDEMIARERHNAGYPMCCGQHAYMDETGEPVCMVCGNMNPSSTRESTYIELPFADKRMGMYCS